MVSFFVFIIFAANSRPVDFCTHLFTIENAPLHRKDTNNVGSVLVFVMQNGLFNKIEF